MSTDKLAGSAAHAIDAVASGVVAVTNSSTAKSLDTALASMIDNSVRNAGDAVAWTKEQIPDVLSQLLTWELLSSTIIFSSLMLVSMVCLAVGVWAYKEFNTANTDYEARKQAYALLHTQWKIMEKLPYGAPGRDEAFGAYFHTNAPTSEDHGGYVALAVIAGILSALFLWMAMCNLEWLQILVAPKVYLLEYAAELLKS